MQTPCEIVVKSVLPTIRRQFANILVNEFQMSQKKVAKILGLTESAISQYLKAKRGTEIKLNENILFFIKKIAKKISESKVVDPIFQTCCICEIIKKSGLLCKIHLEKENSLKNCELCLSS